MTPIASKVEAVESLDTWTEIKKLIWHQDSVILCINMNINNINNKQSRAVIHRCSIWSSCSKQRRKKHWLLSGMFLFLRPCKQFKNCWSQTKVSDIRNNLTFLRTTKFVGITDTASCWVLAFHEENKVNKVSKGKDTVISNNFSN